MRALFVLALLLLAFPTAASEWDSCNATARALDDGYQQADEAAQRGDFSEAGRIRRNNQMGVDSFMGVCIKPRVCPSYYRKMQHYLPREYSKTKGSEFTTFRDMWDKADHPAMCSDDDCTALAKETDELDGMAIAAETRSPPGEAREKALNAQLSYIRLCIRNCSNLLPGSLKNSGMVTQWQQHDRIYCRNEDKTYHPQWILADQISNEANYFYDEKSIKNTVNGNILVTTKRYPLGKGKIFTVAQSEFDCHGRSRDFSVDTMNEKPGSEGEKIATKTYSDPLSPFPAGSGKASIEEAVCSQ